jgi:hypothetical protein
MISRSVHLACLPFFLSGAGAVSVALTVFLVPAAYLLAHERSEPVCD